MWFRSTIVFAAIVGVFGAKLDEESKKWLYNILKPINATETTTTTEDFNAGLVGSNNVCTLDDGRSGVCVVYYQCNSDTKTVIIDGSSLIDVRQEATCPHYLEVCCSTQSLKPVIRREQAIPMVQTRPNEKSTCGWTNPGGLDSTRIFTNDPDSAQYSEYPWMIALLKKSGTTAWQQGDFIGGGVLIHPSVVLTAAHKIDGKQASELKCRAGEWDTQTENEKDPHQDIDVKTVITHPDFYRPSLYNDVALLIMEKPFVMAPNVGIACLGTDLPPTGTKCESMGWGVDFKQKNKYAVLLKKLEIPLVARDTCETELRKTRLGTFFELHQSLTCAGGQGKDTCRGDGGSSLVCPISDAKGRYAVYGLVAYGIGCGKDGRPAVYVNMPEFTRWVEDEMINQGYNTNSYTI